MVTKDQRGRAYALSFLGYLICCSEQNYVAAKALIEEGLACLKEMGDQRGIAKALYRLGCIAFKQGDFAATHTFYEQSLTILQDVEDTWLLTACLEKHGGVAISQGQHAWATRLLGAPESRVRTIEPLKPLTAVLHHRTVAALVDKGGKFS